METVNWKVEGMSCSACAQTINGFLEKKGMLDVKVSLTAGEAHFRNETGVPELELKKGIENLSRFMHTLYADSAITYAGPWFAFPLAPKFLDSTDAVSARFRCGNELFWEKCHKQHQTRAT
jgi:copper chaperone CopZ